MSLSISIFYRTEQGEFSDVRLANEHYSIKRTCVGGNVKLVLVPKCRMEIESFSVKLKRGFVNGDKFFMNGYQAWTTSREMTVRDVATSFTPLAGISGRTARLAAMSGDYFFCDYNGKPGVFHSHTYTYVRNGEIVTFYGSLNEKTGFTVFEADMNRGLLTIIKDVEGLCVSEPYELLNVVTYIGGYDEVFDKYFAALNLPKPRTQRLTGYTSWYNYFQKIDHKIILRDLAGLGRVGESANIFQIDDGYEPFVGDWLDPSPKFPNGMKFIADRIHYDYGYLAGIWLAPFSVQKGARVAKEHPEWLITDENGKPELGCFSWGGAYTLDIYIPEVREHIRHFFDVILNEWGFDMVKLDFLYSQCISPRNGKTRGEIMDYAMAFSRECVGDKLILGCGVPLGSAFGYVDACRISCDVDLKYTGKFYNKLRINNEIPSAQNAINNSIFRRHLDGRAFCSDPDVFFLRKNNLDFTGEQKQLLAKVNSLCGSVLFVSDNIGDYDDGALAQLKDIFDNHDAKIISAEYIDADIIEIKYFDECELTLRFNIKTGAIL